MENTAKNRQRIARLSIESMTPEEQYEALMYEIKARYKREPGLFDTDVQVLEDEETCETCGRVLDPERGHVAPVCDDECAAEQHEAPEPETPTDWREALAFLDKPRQHTMDLITDRELAARLLMALQSTGNAAGVQDENGTLYVPWLSEYRGDGDRLYGGAGDALKAIAPQVAAEALQNCECTFPVHEVLDIDGDPVASIEVQGQRWRDELGNTYHACRVIVNGEDYLLSEITYGYDWQFETTALEMLRDSGHVTGLGCIDGLSHYDLRAMGIRYTCEPAKWVETREQLTQWGTK